MNLIKKLSQKFCRASAKSPFISNNIRFALLRRTGIPIGKDVVINEGITIVCDIGRLISQSLTSVILRIQGGRGEVQTRSGILLPVRRNILLLREVMSLLPGFQRRMSAGYMLLPIRRDGNGHLVTGCIVR